MNIASISRFLHSIAALGAVVFEQGLTQSDWLVLIALGSAQSSASPGTPVLQEGQDEIGAQSYKSLKCLCGLSDDALSRSLKRLVCLGLVRRHNGEQDQRRVLYTLSEKAAEGFVRMGRLVMAEMGGLVISLSQGLNPQPEETTARKSRGADR